MITLVSMCILPVTAILVVSETCAASEVTYVLKIELGDLNYLSVAILPWPQNVIILRRRPNMTH